MYIYIYIYIYISKGYISLKGKEERLYSIYINIYYIYTSHFFPAFGCLYIYIYIYRERERERERGRERDK